MGKSNTCNCKCGCTEKCKKPSMNEYMVRKGAGLNPNDLFLCENCFNGQHKPSNTDEPLDALKRRLAKGEITPDEYYRLKSIIEND
jgi:hypothetical protein